MIYEAAHWDPDNYGSYIVVDSEQPVAIAVPVALQAASSCNLV